ncbi:MAG: Na+/H+ antiporter NhaA, partial [Afipia sp.]
GRRRSGRLLLRPVAGFYSAVDSPSAFASLERFLHIEAVSGVVLLAAAAIALIWANSALSDSYHHLWHVSLSPRSLSR